MFLLLDSHSHFFLLLSFNVSAHCQIQWLNSGYSIEMIKSPNVVFFLWWCLSLIQWCEELRKSYCFCNSQFTSDLLLSLRWILLEFLMRTYLFTTYFLVNVEFQSVPSHYCKTSTNFAIIKKNNNNHKVFFFRFPPHVVSN